MKRRILLAALACALSWVLSLSALASGYPAPQDLGYTVSYAKVEWVHQYGGAVQLLQGEPVVMAERSPARARTEAKELCAPITM